MPCQVCGVDGPTMPVEFHQNIGMLVLRTSKTMRGNLCRNCINKTFNDYTLTTALLGWWGIISFIMTPIFLIGNIVQYSKTKNLPYPTPGARPLGPGAFSASLTPSNYAPSYAPPPGAIAAPPAQPLTAPPPAAPSLNGSAALSSVAPTAPAAPLPPEVMQRLNQYYNDIMARLHAGYTLEQIATEVSPYAGVTPQEALSYVRGLVQAQPLPPGR